MGRLSRVQRAVLEVIQQDGRTHAYAVKRSLRGVVGHASVYAALAVAQSRGFVRAEWSIPENGAAGGPPRKYFELTPEGIRALMGLDEAPAPVPKRPVPRRPTRTGATS